MVLGADRYSTIWLVVGDALTMIVWGISMGLPFVWALGRLIDSQFFDVKPFDLAAIAAAVLVLSLASLGGIRSWASGRHVNPTDALRAEWHGRALEQPSWLGGTLHAAALADPIRDRDSAADDAHRDKRKHRPFESRRVGDA